MKKFPGGILGLYTLIILISSFYPVAYLMRNPAAPKPLLIFSTAYFFVIGLLLWARKPVAALLFLVGLLGLCGWTIWRIFAADLTFSRCAMLVAWLVACRACSCCAMRSVRGSRSSGRASARGS